MKFTLLLLIILGVVALISIPVAEGLLLAYLALRVINYFDDVAYKIDLISKKIDN